MNIVSSHTGNRVTGTTGRDHKIGLASLVLSVSVAVAAQVGMITEFTGGDVIAGPNGAVSSIDGSTTQYRATEYHESGIKMTTTGDSIFIGNYYEGGNGVIHGHWSSMTQVKFEKVDGSSFDTNYFKLTSNPTRALGHSGGAPGNAVVSIVASVDGTTESFRVTMPGEEWGDEFRGDRSVTEVYLGPEFDGIKAFWFESDIAEVQCFGMDTFYIDLPPPVPTSGTAIVLGSGSVQDAISGGSSSQATAVPAVPYFMLMMLSAALGFFGLRKLKK